jgi:hypothetical protein
MNMIGKTFLEELDELDKARFTEELPQGICECGDL